MSIKTGSHCEDARVFIRLSNGISDRGITTSGNNKVIYSALLVMTIGFSTD